MFFVGTPKHPEMVNNTFGRGKPSWTEEREWPCEILNFFYSFFLPSHQLKIYVLMYLLQANVVENKLKESPNS